MCKLTDTFHNGDDDGDNDGDNDDDDDEDDGDDDKHYKTTFIITDD